MGQECGHTSVDLNRSLLRLSTAGLDWDALAAQAVPPTYVPDVSISNNSVGAAASAALVLEEEAAATAPPIPASEQAKFAGYEYRVHANDDKTGRTERVPYVRSGGGMSLGPDSMRQSTISMAATTEVLNGASVANYASMNYRPCEVGGSALYGLSGPGGSPSGSGIYGSRRTPGASTVVVSPGSSATKARTGGGSGSGLYVLTPVSPVGPGPAQPAASSPVGPQSGGPSMPVAPADVPPGRMPMRSNSFAQEQARLAALELHEGLVGEGIIPLAPQQSVAGGSPRANPNGGVELSSIAGRRSSFKGSRRSISRSTKIIGIPAVPGGGSGGDAYAVDRPG